MDKILGSYMDKHHSHCRYRRHIEKRNSIRRQYERLVFKTGDFNFEKSMHKTKFNIIPYIFTKFIDAKWKWSLVFCVLAYNLIWLVFAAIWWIILYAHGDLEEENLPSSSNTTEWRPCVREIYSFTSIFLFSIEIHTTLGYGKRAITLECPTAMLTMCIESIAGHFTQSLIVGIIFAKLTRPKNRVQTIIFSKNAIVNQRDGHLCMIFRVGNARKSRIIAVKVNAYLIQHERNTTNQTNSEQINLNIKVDASDAIFFLSPISIVHKIDRQSPFYDLSAADMLKSDLEIIVVLEGIIESTGQPVQAITSYISQEILWGRRFSEVIHFQKDKQGFIKDYSKFDETCRVNTPLCKARELDKYYDNRRKISKQDNLLYLHDLLSTYRSSLYISKSK